MATEEFINIVELQIKEDDVIKKLTELKQKQDEVRASTKQLEQENKKLEEQGLKNSDAYKNNAAEIEKNKAQVKGLSTEYRNNQAVLVSLNKDQTNNLKSINDLVARNKALRQERNQLDITTEKGQKRLKELNAEIDKNDKLIKDNNDNLVKQKINIGNYASALDGLPGPIGASVNGFKALTKSALAFIATPIGAIIAAIVVAFKLFQSALKNSQPLMDKLDAAGAAFSATFKVILDRVSTFAETIVDAFANPKQAVADLWEAIKTNVLNRIQGLVDTFTGLGRVIKSVFKLNFEEAGQAAKDVGKSITEAFTGVKFETIQNGFKGIADEIKREAVEASNLENQLRALEDAEIAFITQRAELNKQARESLTLSKDQTKSNEERIAGLQNYLNIQDQIYGREVELAKERARISQAQVDQGNSTREELRANAELQAQAANLEAELARRRGEAVSLLSGLKKKLFNEEMSRVQAELKAKADLLKAELELNNEFKELEDQDRADMLAAIEMDNENRLALLNDSIFAELEAERQKLELKKQLEIEAAEAIGADTTLIRKKYADADLALEMKTTDAKLDLASQALGNIASIFGKNTKIAKAAAATQTAIDTIKGAISAYSSLAGIPIVGPVLGGIAAAAVGVAGAKAVRDIYATKSGLPGDGGGGGSIPSVNIGGGSRTGGTSRANINDGGVVNRATASGSIKDEVKQGFSEALKDNPLQPTLVVDDVENRMSERASVKSTATI